MIFRNSSSANFKRKIGFIDVILCTLFGIVFPLYHGCSGKSIVSFLFIVSYDKYYTNSTDSNTCNLAAACICTIQQVTVMTNYDSSWHDAQACGQAHVLGPYANDESCKNHARISPGAWISRLSPFTHVPARGLDRTDQALAYVFIEFIQGSFVAIVRVHMANLLAMLYYYFPWIETRKSIYFNYFSEIHQPEKKLTRT